MTMGAFALGIVPIALAQPAKAPTSTQAKPPAQGAAGTAAAASTAAAPPHAQQSAIVHIASEITRGLGSIPSGVLVAVSPLVSDSPAPKGDELAVRVASQIAGRIGTAHVHPHPVTLAMARGVSGRAASLVYVQLEIAKGELRATADLYPVISNAWERLKSPTPGPRAHAFAGAPLDAEVRTFLQPIVLEQASVHKAKHEETDVLAVGCGDVDADGGNEIILATRTRVVLGKLRGGKLAIVRATPWTQLASRVPVPMREPIASVVVPRGHRGELLVGMTDRGAVAVDASLVTRRQLTGLPIPGGEGEACALASPELGAFEGSGIACVAPANGEPSAVLPTPAARFDAIASLDLIATDGAVTQIVAAREPTGKIRLRRSEANGKSIEAPIDGAGAQIALADLDLDGTPEIAFSGDSGERPSEARGRQTGPEGDMLAIWSWRPTGLVQRLRLSTTEGVRAIAACPPEEKGLPALVAVVGAEVWLVR
jgi:hypothetical protein